MNPDSLPPGFTLSLLLKSTLKRFDEFLSSLPASAAPVS